VREEHLGRTVLRLYQHNTNNLNPYIRSSIGAIIHTGQAIDYVVRLRGFGTELTPELASQFSRFAGIDPTHLRLLVLPALERAGVVDYSMEGNNLKYIEEYVGVSAPLLDQVIKIFEGFDPSRIERCVLHSADLGTWAPLTYREHLDYLIRQGYTEQDAAEAISITQSIGINRRMNAVRLADSVIYSPYVWGSNVVIDIAAFLRSLSPNERDVLLGVCEAAALRPGITLSEMHPWDPAVVRGVRKVGLLQAATVVSTTAKGSQQTYFFSPLLDSEDNSFRTTEALHERKLFVAHILFGHEKAVQAGGRIHNPLALVNALLQRGQVGPASNIRRDYHLLEASGIVRVEPGSSRPSMIMVKEEIVADGLQLLKQSLGTTDQLTGAVLPPSGLLRPPTQFISPEKDRAEINDADATMEVLNSALLKLREDAQRATRHENPFD